MDAARTTRAAREVFHSRAQKSFPWAYHLHTIATIRPEPHAHLPYLMTLSFGPFVLDEDARELLRDGQPLSLQPRALELLLYLARNRDRTVGKNELLDALWPDVTVTDASIERAVSLVRSELRKGGCENAIQDPSEARLSFRAPRHCAGGGTARV